MRNYTKLINKFSQYDEFEDVSPPTDAIDGPDYSLQLMYDINEFNVYKNFTTINSALKTTYRLFVTSASLIQNLLDRLEFNPEESPHINIDLSPAAEECYNALDAYEKKLMSKHEHQLEDPRYKYLSFLDDILIDLGALLNSGEGLLIINQDTDFESLEVLFNFCQNLASSIGQCLKESGDLSHPLDISGMKLEGKDTLTDLLPYGTNIDTTKNQQNNLPDRQMKPEEASQKITDIEPPMETDIRKLNYLANKYLKLANLAITKLSQSENEFIKLSHEFENKLDRLIVLATEAPKPVVAQKIKQANSNLRKIARILDVSVQIPYTTNQNDLFYIKKIIIDFVHDPNDRNSKIKKINSFLYDHIYDDWFAV